MCRLDEAFIKSLMNDTLIEGFTFTKKRIATCREGEAMENNNSKAELNRQYESQNQSFLYYSSNIYALEKLPIEAQSRANMAIIEYGAGLEIKNPIIQVDEQCIDLRIFFRQIFNSIDTEKRRYKNKEKINKRKEQLTKISSELADGGTIKGKGIELAIKDLRRLAVEAQKSDIRNIDERIAEIMPGGYLKYFYNRLEDTEKEGLVAFYFDWIINNNLLTQQEGETIKELFMKAKKAFEDRQIAIQNRPDAFRRWQWIGLRLMRNMIL